VIDILNCCQAKDHYWTQTANKYAFNSCQRKQQHTWIASCLKKLTIPRHSQVEINKRY